MTEKVVLALSGGLDSTTLLYDLLQQDLQVSALCINYGQHQQRELHCAAEVCDRLQVVYNIVDLSSINKFFKHCALTNDVPLANVRYSDPEMSATVVPNRNMIILAIAAAWAVAEQASAIVYAANRDDYPAYHDCRPAFVQAMEQAFALCDRHRVELLAPYLHLSKADVVKRGLQLHVPYELTWSCYRPGEKACGRCGACHSRLAAFEEAGRLDPLAYEGFGEEAPRRAANF